MAQLGRLQNAVIYRTVGIIDSLIPDDGKIIAAAMIPAEGSEAEVSAHDGVAAAGQGRQRAGEAVGHGAAAVHSQQLDIAAAASDTMPTDDKSVIPDAKVGCNDLGVFVKIAVTGRQHGCTGISVSSHSTIGDLVVGGISGSAAVQRVNRHSGSVGQHGRLQRLHAASSTVIKHLGLAPGAAVIATVHDTISGREGQQAVAALRTGIGGVDAAPEHDGLAVAHCRGWSQIRRAVVGQAGGSPGCAVIDGHYDLRAVHHQVLLFQCHGITGIFTRQVGAHANPSRRREAVSTG